MAAPATSQTAAGAAGRTPSHRLGLIVNPIAGMGGPVALKGTDGKLDEARRRGAEPVAHQRAVRFLRALEGVDEMLTCSGSMGAAACREAGVNFEPVIEVGEPTTAADTRTAAAAMAEAGMALIVFIGGDGTARDVAEAIGHQVPCLGVPSGVKMNSAVFAETPEAGARVTALFLDGKTNAVEREVVEVDEQALAQGEVAPVQLASLLVPEDPAIAPSKAEPGGTLDGIIEAVEDLAAPGTTLVLGPGTTTLAAKRALVGAGTLLGVDVVRIDEEGGARLILQDATASELEGVRPPARIVVSPIGGQGFVIGRGNQQLTPGLLDRLGWDAMVVVATPAKLQGLDALRADTGSPGLDARAPGHLHVLTGPGFRRMLPLRTGSDSEPVQP